MTKGNALFRKHILPAVQKMYERQVKTRDGNTRKYYNSSGEDINVALIRKAASGWGK